MRDWVKGNHVFFFQAEDGIRDYKVTGVQTCALPISRTLNLAQFIRFYVAHQVEVIVRRTAYRLRKAEERAHILRGLAKALDALDEVIEIGRASCRERV